MDVCSEKLGVACFLDEGEIGTDEKAMMTFLAQIYQRFGTREEVTVNRQMEEQQSLVDAGASCLAGDYMNARRFQMNQFDILPKDASGNSVLCKYRQVGIGFCNASYVALLAEYKKYIRTS